MGLRRKYEFGAPSLPQTAHLAANPGRGMGGVMGLDGGADWERERNIIYIIDCCNPKLL